MELSGSSRTLIHSGMAEPGCGCCGCCGSARPNALIQAEHPKERRLRRLARLLTGACVLLVSLVLGVLVLLVLAVRGHHEQLPKDSARDLPAHSKQEQPKVLGNPRAMLTVSSDSNIKETYLPWESKFGLAFCSGGFSYANGSLAVPKDGLYRVYLQITYEVDCTKKTFPKIANKVYYNCPEYPKDKIILQAVDTVRCGEDEAGVEDGGRWTKSLYTSGLFNLTAKSTLWVKSTHPEHIVRKEFLGFFGAELLPR